MHSVSRHDDPVTRATQWAIWLPLLFLGVFFLLPLATITERFFSWSAVANVIRDSDTWEVAGFTTWQACLSTVASLAIGLPATWALSRWSFHGARLLRGLLTAPFVLPSVVVGAAVLTTLPESANRGLHAIVWAHVVFNVSVVVRVVGPRWAQLDARFVDAAHTLGASPWQVWRHITWPQLAGSTRTASLIVFIFCFTSFGVVAIVGGVTRRTIEVEIFTQAVSLGDTSTAVVLSGIQIVVIAVVSWATHPGRTVVNGDITSPQTATSALLSTKPRLRWAVVTTATTAAVVVSLPLLTTLWSSFVVDGSWTMSSWRALTESELPSLSVSTWDVVSMSVAIAVIAVIVAVPLALVCATYLTRSQSRGRPWVARIVSLPVVVSAVTVGLGMIITFDASPIDWRSHWQLIPLVHAVVALPLAVGILAPTLGSVPIALRQAAATLGASPWRVWWHIDARLARGALARATGVTAAVSLGEFGATSFLSRSDSTTLPIAISQLLGRPGDAPQQAGIALTALMIVLTIGVMSRA